MCESGCVPSKNSTPTTEKKQQHILKQLEDSPFPPEPTPPKKKRAQAKFRPTDHRWTPDAEPLHHEVRDHPVEVEPIEEPPLNQVLTRRNALRPDEARLRLLVFSKATRNAEAQGQSQGSRGERAFSIIQHKDRGSRSVAFISVKEKSIWPNRVPCRSYTTPAPQVSRCNPPSLVGFFYT